MAKNMSSATNEAELFFDLCKQHGFSVHVDDNCVDVQKSFKPGDLAAFAECDRKGPYLLSHVPLKGGCIWGTDGASIGGFSAVQNGHYRLVKSGYRAKRFMAALTALVQRQ